jgi:hypothetical protein
MMLRDYLRHSEDAMPNGEIAISWNFWIYGIKLTILFFKVVEFDHFKKQAGLASFVLSVSEYIAN